MGSQPEPTGPKLMPWPESMDKGAGALVLKGAAFSIAQDGDRSPRVEAAVADLCRTGVRRTGLSESGPATEIRLRYASAGDEVPGIAEDESYWLVVDDAGIYLDAGTEWGALRGLVTLGQLVGEDATIPHVAIDDRPRFPWRGLLLDPARHFLPEDALLRTLNGMARCKLNVLHLHLTDDQGFRFAVPEYPELASTDHYSDQTLSRVVSHAAALGIRVVPEIDMPGHVTSWLTAYPAWGARQVSPAERFGVHGACLDPTFEAVYKAIGSILDALVAVFPDPCLHIGGDEVSPRWWSEDPNVRALMEREGLADIRAVQGYFNRRVGQMVADRGRQVLAWDEVLDAGSDVGPGDDWIIQAWRGATMRDRSLATGNRVLVSAPYYLDLHFPTDVHYGFDPAASQTELMAREDALLEDARFVHVADGMRWTEQWREGAVQKAVPVNDAHLLGGEACLWSELVNDAVLDLRLWSRLPAVAERFWSSDALQDAEDACRRQDWFVEQELPLAGIDLGAATLEHWRRLDVTGAWIELVRMLEPVKWYGRLLGAQALAARIAGREMPQARPYDLASPLDCLIDHLPPESRQARGLAGLCRSASAGDGPAKSQVLATLQRWRELAAEKRQAPADLAEPAARLAELGEVIGARLEQDIVIAEADVRALLVPMGEFMLAMPPALHAWLTGR